MDATNSRIVRNSGIGHPYFAAVTRNSRCSNPVATTFWADCIAASTNMISNLYLYWARRRLPTSEHDGQMTAMPR